MHVKDPRGVGVGGQVASHIEYRDIKDPGSKEFVHLELVNPIAPTG
jgi:hypothetical protein